jgi:hypothetical protein
MGRREETAAEKLADWIRTADLSDPILKKLELASVEFLRSKGFDISTQVGCKAALSWLESAPVEEAFWEQDGKVDNAADWYIGEARLDGMRRIVEERIKQHFSGES